MSYRCGKCDVVCAHPQIKIVTETRAKKHGPGHDIVRETSLCHDCAAEAKINVRMPSIDMAVVVDDSIGSQLVGSA